MTLKLLGHRARWFASPIEMCAKIKAHQIIFVLAIPMMPSQVVANFHNQLLKHHTIAVKNCKEWASSIQTDGSTLDRYQIFFLPVNDRPKSREPIATVKQQRIAQGRT
jgi:hypothetical protein